jgi:Tol biopolymer transport system component
LRSETRSAIVAAAVLMTALAVTPVPAEGQELPLQLTWVDRTGQAIQTVGPPGAYRGPDVSPDGTRVIVHRHDGNGGDLWLDDGRGGLAPFATDATGTQENASPIFSPDGTRVVFASLRDGRWGLYVKRVDGTGGEELLIESGSRKMPMSWSPDGRFIVYWVAGGSQWVIPASGKGEPQPLNDIGNSHAQISPDGRWVAYNALGQIWVKPFPTGEGNWQVSTEGGAFPRWRGDSRELYFMGRGFVFSQMMAVDINVTGSTLEPGTPHPLFESGYINLGHPSNYHTFSVSSDGQRFLIPRLAPNSLAVFDRDGRTVRTLGSGVYWYPVWSPDGSRVAVIKDRREIWVVEAATGRSVRLTANQEQDMAVGLVWSPDGRQLAYSVQRINGQVLYRIASDGTGPEELLYRVPGFGVSLTDWSPDGGFVIYSSSQLGGNRLFALPVTADPKPVEIMRSDAPILGARLSPDGRLLAYQSTDSEQDPIESVRRRIWVRPFDMATGAGAPSVPAAGEANLTMGLGIWWRQDGRELYYLGPEHGVMAVDVRAAPSVELGTPRRLFTVPDELPERQNAGAAGFLGWGSVSRDGQRVVFATTPSGASAPPGQLSQLALLDRQGAVLQRVGPVDRYGQPALSPDGTRIAVRHVQSPDLGGQSDIWSIDIASGKATPITDDVAQDFSPLWSPDGQQILYVSLRSGGYNGIYRKAADGSGSEELLYRYEPGAPVNLRDISADGRYLTFNSGGVILVLPLTGTDPSARKAIELSREEFAVAGGVFSPDGRFVAYGTNETDRFELYVQPFDTASGTLASEGKQRVSQAGTGPMMFWRSDGRELFFTDTEPDLVVMAVDVSTDTGFQPGTPRVLFHVPGNALGDLGTTKYVSRDGQRFVFILPAEGAQASVR